MKKADILKALEAMTDDQLAAVDRKLADNRRRKTALRVYKEQLDAGEGTELAAAVEAVQADTEAAAPVDEPVASVTEPAAEPAAPVKSAKAAAK